MIENIKLSCQSIFTHKLRSFLTTLGIIVGISAIIVIFSIINGNTENMKKQIIGGQTNAMKIEFGPRSSFILGESAKNESKPDYVPKISEVNLKKSARVADLKNISLLYESSLSVFVKEKRSEMSVLGIDASFFSIFPHELENGRFFFKDEYASRKQTCLISFEAVEELYAPLNPIGRFIEINGVPFRIVGIINSQTDQIFGKTIYVSTESKEIAEQQLNHKPTILIQTKDAETLEKAAAVVSQELTNLVPPSDYVFSMQSHEEIKRMTEEINQSNLILLGGIASISLLVGGIGVMNTMLVSVTERTREIGIKKALGAKRKVILEQFLTEAIVLSGIGGIVGLLLGIVISFIATYFLQYPFMISTFSVVVSVLFSILIGILFGFLPANRAAKLHPIDALRYE